VLTITRETAGREDVVAAAAARVRVTRDLEEAAAGDDNTGKAAATRAERTKAPPTRCIERQEQRKKDLKGREKEKEKNEKESKDQKRLGFVDLLDYSLCSTFIHSPSWRMN